MLKIRLTRTGKTNDPRFRIVVAEHTKPVKGKFIEIVGHHDPIHKKTVVKKDAIIDWLNKGALPSNRVAIILTNEGVKHKSIVIQKFNKKPKSKKDVNKDGATQKPATIPAENKVQVDENKDKEDEPKEVKIEDKKDAQADKSDK